MLLIAYEDVRSMHEIRPNPNCRMLRGLEQCLAEFGVFVQTDIELLGISLRLLDGIQLFAWRIMWIVVQGFRQPQKLFDTAA